MFLYYEEGNPKAVVAPDVFVAIGAPKRDRFSYLLWKEPKGPDFVLEITSRSTRSEDQGSKRGVYAFLEIKEYWQYDPTGDYLMPPLQSFRLVDKNYQPMPAEIAENGELSMHSDVLGLDLRLENNMLRFFDPVTGQKLLSYQEAEQARQIAEARIAELEARLKRLEEKLSPKEE